MYCKTIYKKDNSGKIRYLTVNIAVNQLQQISGVMNTDNPVVHSKDCYGKNIGKSNETSDHEQAVLEGKSIIAEKMRLGYFETIDEATEKGGKNFLLPMLAKDYKKEFKKVKFPFFAQPKLDGMRALHSGEDSFTSRTGKFIETIQHIVINKNDEDLVPDGELYAHGKTFQETMKLIKKYRKGETEQIKYHVYDLVTKGSFEERFAKLTELVKNNSHVELVKTVQINNEQELLEFHKENIANGYEGTIIRHGDADYEVNHRSSSLLKYKDFLDEAYQVIDIIPSEARPEQGVVVCICKKTNQKFNTGMKFSHAEREEILKNKEQYVGQMAEIRFFELTDGGLPRFPVCYGFRLDK